jgi:hypothetical protein
MSEMRRAAGDALRWICPSLGDRLRGREVTFRSKPWSQFLFGSRDHRHCYLHTPFFLCAHQRMSGWNLPIRTFLASMFRDRFKIRASPGNREQVNEHFLFCSPEPKNGFSSDQIHPRCQWYMFYFSKWKPSLGLCIKTMHTVLFYSTKSNT